MPSSVFWGMQHLNANVLCGIKTELTGPDPEMHEIIEVAVLPVDQLFEVHKEFPLFNMRMRPMEAQPFDDFKECRLTRPEIAQALLRAFDRDKVADLLQDWFESLKLPRGKKLLPLTYNYPMERQIMINWLGYDQYREIFSEDYRDIKVAAHFINDKNCCRAEPAVYSKQTASWLAKIHHIEPVERGTAVSDAFMYAQIYKRMLQS